MSFKGNCPICEVKTSCGFLCDDCAKEQADKMVMHEFTISLDKYDEYAKLVSCAHMIDNKAKGVIQYKGKLYVITGAIGAGSNKRDCSLHAHEVVPLEHHEGPTYTYAQCGNVNGSGGYFHSNNQRFSCKGKKYVVVPYVEVIFLPNNDPILVQEALF